MKKSLFFDTIVSHKAEQILCLPHLEELVREIKTRGLKRRDVVSSLAHTYRCLRLKQYEPQLAMVYLFSHLIQTYGYKKADK